MKTLLKIIAVSIVMFGIMAFVKVTTKEEPIPVVVETKEVIIKDSRIFNPYLSIKGKKDHYAFLYAIGHAESSNQYEVVNKFGYMGRYQFGRATLKGLGYNVTKSAFLKDETLQEQVMEELLVHNSKVLRRQIKKYDGKVVNGVYVTKSGILAAAHLAGPTNVKKWLKNGTRFEDGLGTRLRTYIKKFSGYQLDI
jgi:soluble lytic murein transglycosylase-like protein